MAEPTVYRETLDGTELIRVLKNGRFYVAPITALLPLVLPQVAVLSARLAKIEGRPEEVAHFTASARLPAITVTQSVNLLLAGIIPAVAGDRVRKGEFVVVEPASALPDGVSVATAYSLADDTVTVRLTTEINLAAGATVAWNITVLR